MAKEPIPRARIVASAFPDNRDRGHGANAAATLMNQETADCPHRGDGASNVPEKGWDGLTAARNRQGQHAILAIAQCEQD